MEQHSVQLAEWLRAYGPSEPDVPRAPQGDDAWEDLARAACEAGLAGLLLEHSSRHNLRLPGHVTARLQHHAMAVAASNINMASELERIVQAFNRASVAVMLLKGAALNLTLYKRPDLRPMSDLDLLIRPEAADDALRLLINHGCRRGSDLMCDGFFPKYHYEMELLTGSPRPARIDLHARPFRPLRVCRMMPDDGFWVDAQAVRVGESEAMVPRAEVMLIHLTAHAAFHGYLRLLWLYDVRRLVDDCGRSMDWELITRRARQWRLSLPVLGALERTAELLGPVCPPTVTEELAAYPVCWRDRMTLIHAPRDATSPISHVVVNLLCTPGIRFRFGYLLAFLLPGRAHLADVYPFRHPGWVPCAYVWRATRALGRVVCAPWHAFLRVNHRVRLHTGLPSRERWRPIQTRRLRLGLGSAARDRA